MLTPITEFLVVKRRQRKLQQQEFAKMLGVGPSYVSAVESGRRLPRAKSFWQQVSRSLALNDAEECAMQEALRRSAPTLKIPPGTSKEIRDILFDLVDHGDSLSDELLEIVQIAAKGRHVRARKGAAMT